MAERWLPVVGYEGLYEVSDLGRVRSLHYGAPRVLKHYVRKDGHPDVTLMDNRRRRTVRVHRLMLEAFVGPLPPGMVSRHLDGIPDHNTLDNLEYATHTRNIQDRKWHKGPNCYHKLSPADVVDIKRRLPHETLTSLGVEFGVTPQTIYAIKIGDIHTDVAA